MIEPKLRFKADDGSQFPDWKEKKLSDMFKKVIEKNRLDLPPLTIVQGYGTIRRDESERRISYDEKGLKNYKAVQKDDFIVHLRSFEGGLEIANQDGIVSPAYHVYRGNDEVHPSFYYPYFRSSSFIKGKLAICVTGVRDGKNIEMGSFDELLIPHPCLPEQQKIAEFLSTIDTVIEKQKETVSAWEERKKGVMQKLFSQEVRLKADDGSDFPEWEIHPLSYYVYENKDRNKKKYYEKKDVLSVSKDAGVVNQIEYMGKSLAGNDLSNYHVVYKGNIIYTKSPLGQQPYGIIKASKMEGVCSTLYAVYHCSEKVIPEFVDYYFSRDEILNRYLKPLVNIGAKHDMKVHNDVAISGNVTFPCIDEQQKIADCLSSLDEVIEKQKATLAAWEEMKKGLLQQMFV